MGNSIPHHKKQKDSEILKARKEQKFHKAKQKPDSNKHIQPNPFMSEKNSETGKVIDDCIVGILTFGFVWCGPLTNMRADSWLGEVSPMVSVTLEGFLGGIFGVLADRLWHGETMGTQGIRNGTLVGLHTLAGALAGYILGNTTAIGHPIGLAALGALVLSLQGMESLRNPIKNGLFFNS